MGVRQPKAWQSAPGGFAQSPLFGLAVAQGQCCVLAASKAAHFHLCRAQISVCLDGRAALCDGLAHPAIAGKGPHVARGVAPGVGRVSGVRTMTDQVPPIYNGIKLQKARILVRLAQGPATGEQLQAECQAPDPRARILELRDEGCEIQTTYVHQVNRDGTFNKVGLYVLHVKNEKQALLFSDEP